jgi:hypothetical protein
MHGLRHVAETSRSHDADVLLQVAGRPARGVETLVDALPALLLADWAAIADQRWPREPVIASAEAPAPLPATPGELPRSRVLTADCGPLLVLPCADDRRRLVVGRSQPPGFTRSELDRCAALLAATLAVVRLGTDQRRAAAVS